MRTLKDREVLIFKTGKKSTDWFGIDIVKVISEQKKISKSETRRLIKQGTVKTLFKDKKLI